ncbi:outer membrane protein [Pseudomonas sp. NFACC32-1]|uniref:MipA/OmpV family protein n=1 Tax=Pseudomonas TaxID=286 RepID=UPI00087621E0|nr:MULTISPECIES: MipA/OmpV family protein [Pseudomonas]MDB6442497.1 MipA/OmpV family protein [Pseudomonas sp. 21TX0197]SCX65471.1 outer membrane protein [Pseudomonas sp. NFACC32-1]SFW84424.1 outer membrane protein [Pseudomonas sp. NFACC09-4]SFX78640.1 outer membrane protein [Pseudomonas sp. NFACC49-2]SFX99720.1 outer membrane protein [Pseudomonas sp. NFACC36]
MSLSRFPAPKRLTALTRCMVISAALVGSSTSLVVRAAEPERAEGSSSWGLGIGAASSQQPYTDIDRDNQVIPLIYFENDYLEVFGTTAEIKLPSLRLDDTQQLKFNAVIHYDSSGYEDDDARILDGMDDRDGGLWAGGNVKWENPWANVTAQWTADASGNSDGQRFTLGLDRTWELGDRIRLTPRLAAVWQDKDYVDYYFGVRDEEARSDRPAYDGKSAMNTEFGLRGTYLFDRHHSVFLDLEAVRLANEIKDSPLVDASTENSVRFGYLYRF